VVSIGQLQRVIDLKWSLIYNIIIFKPVLKLANKTSDVASWPIRFCIGSLLDFVDCLFLFLFFFWVVFTCVLICLVLLMNGLPSLIFVSGFFFSQPGLMEC